MKLFDSPKQVFLSTFILALVVWLSSHLLASTFLSEYSSLVLAAFMLYFTLHKASQLGLKSYHLELGGIFMAPPVEDDFLGLKSLFKTIKEAWPSMIQEFLFSLKIITIIFPPFILGYYLWNQPQHDFLWQLPENFLLFTLNQIIIVALPEEMFFRGYVQTSFEKHYPAKNKWQFPFLAIILQAVLFALIHPLSNYNLLSLSVFFPGLLFGYIRFKRQGIGAAILVHAFSNMLSHYLYINWF